MCVELNNLRTKTWSEKAKKDSKVSLDKVTELLDANEER